MVEDHYSNSWRGEAEGWTIKTVNDCSLLILGSYHWQSCSSGVSLYHEWFVIIMVRISFFPSTTQFYILWHNPIAWRQWREAEKRKRKQKARKGDMSYFHELFSHCAFPSCKLNHVISQKQTKTNLKQTEIRPGVHLVLVSIWLREKWDEKVVNAICSCGIIVQCSWFQKSDPKTQYVVT